jgi:hypothetical protein
MSVAYWDTVVQAAIHQTRLILARWLNVYPQAMALRRVAGFQ